jgi:hypothetical protein
MKQAGETVQLGSDFPFVGKGSGEDVFAGLRIVRRLKGGWASEAFPDADDHTPQVCPFVSDVPIQSRHG